MKNGKSTNESDESERNSSELGKLFDYPSVGELFSGTDNRRLDEFLLKLNGSREDAERAVRAVRGIEVTVEFLQELQNRRKSL